MVSSITNQMNSKYLQSEIRQTHSGDHRIIAADFFFIDGCKHSDSVVSVVHLFDKPWSERHSLKLLIT